MKKIVYILILTLILNLNIKADDLSIDALNELEMNFFSKNNIEIVTANKTKQNIKLSPATVSVVTAADIEKSGAVNIAEALRNIAGVYFGYSSLSFPLAGGIRGFSKLPSNKIILLIDGIDWSVNLYNIPEIFITTISLKEIDRIEILKGPGSALYGPNAMFGVINIITKKIQKGSSLSAKIGNNNYVDYTFMTENKILDKLKYRLMLKYNRFDEPGYISYLENPSTKVKKIHTTLNYDINKDNKLIFNFGFFKPEKIYTVFGSAGTVDWSNDKTLNVSAKLKNSFYDYEIKTFYNEIDKNKGWSMGDTYLSTYMDKKGIDVQKQFQINDNNFIIGGNYTISMVEMFSLKTKYKIYSSGLFSDNYFNVSDKFKIDISGRFDKNSVTEDVLSHRISFLYNLNEKHRFRLSEGTSFRNPDFVELFYKRKNSNVIGTSGGLNQYLYVAGNKNLKPESATSYELSYSYTPVKQFRLNTNIFYAKVKQFINFIAQPSNAYFDLDANGLGDSGLVIPDLCINTGDAQQIGLEFELEYMILKKLNVIFNYTYLDEHKLNSNSNLDLSINPTPKNTANLVLQSNLFEKLDCYLAFHYKDSTNWQKFEWPNPITGTTIGGGYEPSFITTDLNLLYKFKTLTLDSKINLTVYNLFNKKYSDYPIDTHDIDRRIFLGYELYF